MNGGLSELNPIKKLRPRLGLLVFSAIALLAIFVGWYFSQHLASAYRDAARAQLQAIATTWDDGFRGTDIENPEALQRRVTKLQESNETLHKISISWHDRQGVTKLVQKGHAHDPDGQKRDISTSEPISYTGSTPAPIDLDAYGSREVRAADGAHYAELNYPIRRGAGSPVAAMELHYDLKTLDADLANDQRTLWIAAGLSAITLSLLVNFLLGQALFRPLATLRKATQRLGHGESSVRLNWHRNDEIGELANDFDRMAEELETAQADLEALALKDPLTGLLNHRAFQERMSQELRRAEREGYSVAIVALDVDHFKEINDRFGHAAGDEALRILARAIRTELRPSDICGRVGGDEFMLGVVRSEAEEAVSIIERLRATVATTQVGPGGQTVTISAGISEFPRHSLSREELMHYADGAMYWAKSSGRNRSTVYTTDSDFALSAQEAADRAARDGLVNTVHALAKAVDAKDGYTHSHSQRVALYGAVLAERLGMSPEQVERVRTAGVLHDVGKIGISDLVLLKPGKLTEDEFDVMRRHSELGRDIIAGAGMDDIAEVVLCLHERYDGRGYPEGLNGDEIPLESRVLHVADTLEAMTSSRVYRRALPVDVALAEIEKHAGTQFDPESAAALVDLVRSGELVVGDEYELSDDEVVMPGLRANGLAPVNGHRAGGNGFTRGNGYSNGHGAVASDPRQSSPSDPFGVRGN